MVGPGTGIAPFRSIIQDELAANSKRPLYVIFGNRSKSKDFYFEAEWTNFEEQHSNFHLFTAFSRDQEDKYYVQHLIGHKREVFGDTIVSQDGFVYVAGNSKQMPDQVKEAFQDAIASLDEDEGKNEAKSYINQMIAEKRYQMETWS